MPTSLLSETAKSIIDGLSALPHPPPYPADPTDLAAWDQAFEANEQQAESLFGALAAEWTGTVSACVLGGTAGLRFEPSKAVGAPLLYLHGGGYTFYSARSARFSAIQMADAAQRVVYSLDYTRAPQGTCETVTKQVVEAMLDLQAMAGSSGYGLFGESAGGGLSIAATLRATDEGVALPRAIVAFSPWADIGGTGLSYRSMEGRDPAFTYADHLFRCAAAYGSAIGFQHPWASPIFGAFDEAFPPTLIQGGTNELLLSDFIRLHRAMRDGGAQAELYLQDGLTHCFPVFFGHTKAQEAVTAYRAAVVHWNRHLS